MKWSSLKKWHYQYLQLMCYLILHWHKWSCTSFQIRIALKHYSEVVCIRHTNACKLCLRYMSIYHFSKLCSKHHQIGPHQHIFLNVNAIVIAQPLKLLKSYRQSFFKRNHHANSKCDLLCMITKITNKIIRVCDYVRITYSVM